MTDERDVLEDRLSPEELSKVRLLILQYERSVWLRSSIRVWAIWVAAVVGGASLFWDSASKIIKLMAGK